MEDILLIVLMAVLFAFGFIPVIKLDRFLRNRRIRTTKPTRRSGKDGCCSENDPVEEFENSGVLYFDMPCDPGQIDNEDFDQME